MLEPEGASPAGAAPVTRALATPAPASATSQDMAALLAAAVGIVAGSSFVWEYTARRSDTEDDRDELERRKVLGIVGCGLFCIGVGYVFDLDKRWYDFNAFREWAEQQVQENAS